MEYIVVEEKYESYSIDILVNEKIKEGYKPLGGLCSIPGQYQPRLAQAMIKE